MASEDEVMGQLAAQDAAEAAALRMRRPYSRPVEGPGIGGGIGQLAEPIVNQPSWMEKAQAESARNAAALQQGGPGAMLALDPSGTIDLAGGFGGVTKAVGKPVIGGLADVAAPPFYSAAQRAVEAAKLGKGTPEQWTGYLRNQPGVKAEEMDWLFGNLPKEGMLTKEQMQAHAAENAVQLGETTFGANAKTMDAIAKDLGYGGWNSSLTEAQKATVNAAYDAQGMRAGVNRYQQYQLPGGENYRETLLTLPGKKVEPSPAEIENIAKTRYEGYHRKENDPPWERIAPDVQRLYREEANAKIIAAESGPQFRSSHWDEPNVLAHIRMNDREVPGVGKSLHLEEIQSDWHQKGRQVGYQRPSYMIQNTKSGNRSQLFDTKDEALAYLDKMPEQLRGDLELREGKPIGAIPDAPFKSTWPDLALKRMIREASEKGYDAVSWTPGEAQAARYDLSKHFDAITAEKYMGKYRLVGRKSGENNWSQLEDDIPPAKLDEYVGKDLADKIRADNQAQKTYEGLDLKVGGEGMKAFYDKMLVDKANALGKKHGARVEQAALPGKPAREIPGAGEGAIPYHKPGTPDQPVHVLRITPELRAAAMKGFPLFSAGGVAAMGGLAQQDNYGQNE